MTRRKLQHMHVEIRASTHSDMASLPYLLHGGPAAESEISLGSEDPLHSVSLQVEQKAVVQLSAAAASENGDNFVIE